MPNRPKKKSDNYKITVRVTDQEIKGKTPDELGHYVGDKVKEAVSKLNSEMLPDIVARAKGLSSG